MPQHKVNLKGKQLQSWIKQKADNKKLNKVKWNGIKYSMSYGKDKLNMKNITEIKWTYELRAPFPVQHFNLWQLNNEA